MGIGAENVTVCHLRGAESLSFFGSGALCVNRGLCRAWTMGEHGTPGSSDRDASKYSPARSSAGDRSTTVHAKCARARFPASPQVTHEALPLEFRRGRGAEGERELGKE